LQTKLAIIRFILLHMSMYIPHLYVVVSQVRSKAKPMCVDSAVDAQNYHKPVNMWPCHNQGGNQYWMLSRNGEIRRDDGCLDYAGGESIIIYPCHGQKGNQEWAYKDVSLTLYYIVPAKQSFKRLFTTGALISHKMVMVINPLNTAL